MFVGKERFIFCSSGLSFLFFSSDRVTEVTTNIYVTSFGPVSDTDMVRTLPLHTQSVCILTC